MTLLEAGLLHPGTTVILIAKGQREVARASLTATGDIAWEGRRYRTLSDRAFRPLLDVAAFNDWTAWYAELPHGRERLADIRARMADGGVRGASGSAASGG